MQWAWRLEVVVLQVVEPLCHRCRRPHPLCTPLHRRWLTGSTPQQQRQHLVVRPQHQPPPLQQQQEEQRATCQHLPHHSGGWQTSSQHWRPLLSLPLLVLLLVMTLSMLPLLVLVVQVLLLRSCPPLPAQWLRWPMSWCGMQTRAPRAAAAQHQAQPQRLHQQHQMLMEEQHRRLLLASKSSSSRTRRRRRFRVCLVQQRSTLEVCWEPHCSRLRP